jgi:hypothetical protein
LSIWDQDSGTEALLKILTFDAAFRTVLLNKEIKIRTLPIFGSKDRYHSKIILHFITLKNLL